MQIEFILLAVLFNFMRKHLQNTKLLPGWNGWIIAGLVFAIAMIFVDMTNPGIRDITVWFAHVLLLTQVIILLKRAEFQKIRPVVFTVLPLIIINFIHDFARLISTNFADRVESYFGMRKVEVEKVKAFASRTHDRARPAYGRRRIDAPRRCIFIATTNEDEYLQSQTGNRRFWPVRTGTIDIDALRRDRDQLWAEAAAIEAKGEALILPKDRWADASNAQDERRQHDPWDDLLASVPAIAYGDEEWIKVSELLVVLQITADRANTETYRRLKRSMQRLGWSKGKFYQNGKEKEQVRGYFRKTQDG